MVVVASFSKVCVFSENDPSARQRYHNNIVFKSFHSGDRFQKLSYRFQFIVFDRFCADARWKRKEKFAVSMKTVWKHIRVDGASVKTIIVFDRFRAGARWKRKEKFKVSLKTIWKRIRVEVASDILDPGRTVELLKFPQRGRQRERHNSFLCFPSKKLTAKKSTINDSLVNLWDNEFKKSLRKKIRRKPASGYQKKTKLIYRRCSLEEVLVETWKLCFPRCVTQRDNFTLYWDTKSLYKI